MNYIIEITGGIGKHIMFTSFIKWLNEKYPKDKIIVVSAFPEIFEYNPRVYRNLPINHAYLFEDYIKHGDYRKGDIYALREFYREKNKKHVMNLFPKSYGFDGADDNPISEVYLTKGEEMDGKVYCNQNKPLITFQGVGGLPPGMMPNRMKLDSNQRDIPMEMAIKIVNTLNMKGYHVLQLRGKEESIIPNTLKLELPFRNMLPIIKHSVAHVGIDSSFMHAASIWNKPQLIFWGGTHLDNFGYKYKGMFNSYTKTGMHGRPNFNAHDREAQYPFKHKNQGSEFDYSSKEIETKIDQLTNYLN